MGEQAATDQVEAIVPKGKCQRIGSYGAVPTEQMSSGPVEVSHVQRDPLTCELKARKLRHLTESCSHFQHREVLASSGARDALDQAACGGDAAEPAVDAAQVPQRSFCFDRRTSV